MLHYLFIHNLIHDLETLYGLLLCDADIRLLQGNRAETIGRKKRIYQQRKLGSIIESDCLFVTSNIPVVEVEESLGRIYTQAGSHILIVGQCGTEAQQAHILLGQLHIADGPRHQRFQHGSTVVVQQVDFILNNTFSKWPCVLHCFLFFFTFVKGVFHDKTLNTLTLLTMIMRRTSWV